MQSNSSLFNKFSNSTILISIILIFFFKVIFFILLGTNSVNFSLGGGSDADYYNAYAIGAVHIAVNIWPVFLRYLNDLGLYSRGSVTNLLFILNLFVIPILVVKLSGLSFKKNQKYYLYSYLLCLIYPTIFFYSLDVYRDVFMVFAFLIGCLIVKKLLNTSGLFLFLFLFVLSLMIGMLLLNLRPYLGYAFIISLFLWKIKFTKKRLIFFTIVYLLALFVANYLGLFSFLTEYRSSLQEAEGGSTLGLNFSNPIMFVPNFILSILGQLFGLYVTNAFAVILLLVETLPFFLMLVYVVKNIKLADNFIRFLVIFFVIYASVWLIGNDNLGTAVRLRIYNYLVIYVSFFHILRLKKISNNLVGSQK